MKAITFLGASQAFQTTYRMPDKRKETAPYFGVALSHFYPNLEMRVFVTKDAKAKHFAAFCEQLSSDIADVKAVDIPDGANEEELWQLFQIMIDEVNEGEEILFDMTHGFRSLPFLSFLAAGYLRIVRKIKLVALLYGNFEARDKSVTPNEAPVIDLTPFISLLDWMMAAERFMQSGDASAIAERLRTEAPDYQAQQEDTRLRDRAYSLKAMAGAMENVSRSLQLIRPAEAMTASHNLQIKLDEISSDTHTHIRPLLPLMKHINDAFAILALPEQADLRGTLERERQMVFWYIERKQYAQAMAVAREWIVTWVLYQAGFTDQLDKNSRAKVEQVINEANKERQHQSGEFGNHIFANGISLDQIDHILVALNLFDQLGNLRNDLLHAGKRKGAEKAVTMEKNITKRCRELEQLPL